jgi:hypothetical protein
MPAKAVPTNPNEFFSWWSVGLNPESMLHIQMLVTVTIKARESSSKIDRRWAKFMETSHIPSPITNSFQNSTAGDESH